MKRVISFLAVISLIVALFSNAAFADPPDPHEVKITLNRTIIPYSSNTKVEEISGRIFSESTKALYQVNSLIKILKDNGDGVVNAADNEIAQVRASGGEFSYKIYTNTDETGAATYWVKGVDSAADTGYTHTKPFTFSGKSTNFTVMYEIELAEPESLNYTYPVTGELVIRGTFVNGDAGANPDIHLAYTDKFDYNDRDNTSIATADFSDTNSFGFLFNGKEFVKTGDIAIYVDGIKAITGKIAPDELQITTSPTKFKNLMPEIFLLDLTIPSTYLDSVNQSLGVDYQLKGIVTKPSGATTTLLFLNYNEPISNFTALQHETTMSFNEVGTNKITYQLWFDQQHMLPPGSVPPEPKDPFIVKEKTIEYKVTKPSRYNLTYWNLNKYKVGDLAFALHSSVYELDKNNVIVLDYVNDSTTEVMDYIEIIIKGCGVDTSFKTFDENGLKPIDSNYDGFFTVNTLQTGEIEVTIKVYEDENDTTANATFTKYVDIYGWNVKVDPNILTVNSTDDIVFTIIDENNQPINNAIIVAEDEKIVDGTTTSIENGRYIYSGDVKEIFKSVQPLSVKLYTSDEYAKGAAGTCELLVNNAIDVVGKEIYTVESNQSTLLNGITETVHITTTDENGEIVYPTFYRIDVDSKGKKSAPVEIPTADLGSFVDTEQGKKARPIKLHANGSQTAIIIRATTDNKKLMGEVTIDVLKPKVEITGITTVTQNFTKETIVKLLDPRNNSVLEYDFDLVKVGSYYDLTIDNDWHYDDKNDCYSKKVLVKNVDYDQAAKDEKDVVLNLVMQADKDTEVIIHSFNITDAKLTPNPEVLVINIPTYLTLKYEDADQNPIAKQQVYLEDFYVGETNEDGEVVYAASATSSRILNFTASTNVENVNTTVKVRATPDIDPPVAKIELIENSSALITITDNVRLSVAYVDGKLVDMPFPKRQATHTVKNLVAGDNSFVVQCMDINNNILDTVITINVNKPEPLIIQKDQPTGYGLMEFVNDTTMVPVRLAEKLGATVSWNEKTQTASYLLNDKTLEITVGEEFALVNGKQVKLTERAYINDKNHVMVPLRLIANELGFEIEWVSNDDPIVIKPHTIDISQ